MRSVIAVTALAALAAAMPQASLAPKSGPPAGCSSSYSGSFQIQVVNVTTNGKRDTELVERQSSSGGALTITLSNGGLKDNQGRTGEIVANHQFQFDNPIQAGAIYTSGWSVCSNGSLALGSQTVFYQCLSGNFYNLYDQSTGNQCSPIYIQVIGGGGSSGAASTRTDGQVTASPVASTRSDGQVTASPASTTARPVSQITDGQVQASTGARPITQISDGQLQVVTARPASQISDGQVQAATGTARPVSQISDGQVQAATSTGRPVTQISDGQIRATTGANTTVAAATATRPASFTGAAMPTALRGEFFGLAAGVIAVALL